MKTLIDEEGNIPDKYNYYYFFHTKYMSVSGNESEEDYNFSSYFSNNHRLSE